MVDQIQKLLEQRVVIYHPVIVRQKSGEHSDILFEKRSLALPVWSGKHGDIHETKNF